VKETVVDCPLGRWTFSECRPRHLQGLIDFIWLFDGSMTCLRERTFPSGELEIIVHLGDRYRVVEERGTWLCPATCLTGLQLGPLVVEAPSNTTRVLGVRLTPAGAYAIFARPLHEVTRLTVDLVDLSGTAAAELVERCQGAGSVTDCFRAAVSWMDHRLADGIRIEPAVGWMVGRIQASAGTASIGALRDRTGFSKTRLADCFRRQVGMTPKQYARVVRFRHVLDRINEGDVSLVEAATDAGYYDQPHMNAEFKELSGFTPGEFLSSARYPNTASVAEA
jgi:AraC-like DNA-binding protein